MGLALVRSTHFAEADARRIVEKNLRDLLWHCRDADASVREAAHGVLDLHGVGGLPFVQQLIAEDMLGLMEELLLESDDNLQKVLDCLHHLRSVVRSLTKLQRQQWVSILVRILHHDIAHDCQKELIGDLQILWLIDSDPSRSFAEAEKQLWNLYKTKITSPDVHYDLFQVLRGC